MAQQPPADDDAAAKRAGGATASAARLEPEGQAAPPAAGPAAANAGGAVPFAGGGLRRLDPRHLRLMRLLGGLAAAAVAAAFLLGVGIVALAVDLRLWVALPLTLVAFAAAAGLAAFAYRWPQLQHRHAAYRVGEGGIEIRRGVWWRRVVNVPRSRVQHTDVSQGPVERRFGLGTLVIYTAGTDHAKVELPGLDHALALRIRDHLLPREADDAV